VFADLLGKRVIFATEGKDKSTWERFVEALEKHNGLNDTRMRNDFYVKPATPLTLLTLLTPLTNFSSCGFRHWRFFLKEGSASLFPDQRRGKKRGPVTRRQALAPSKL